MTARNSDELVKSAAAKLRGGAKRRTYQRVRNRSYHAGKREQRKWRQHNMFPKEHNRAFLLAAEQIGTETKGFGMKKGKIGYVAVKVLRLLLKRRGAKDGRLDPTKGYIADEIGHSLSAVHDALTELREADFLCWDRRTQLLEEPTPDGQYVEQISNAYYFSPAGRAIELICRILRIPRPDQQERLKREAREAATASRSANDWIEKCSDPLAALLRSIGSSVDSANPPNGEIPVPKA